MINLTCIFLNNLEKLLPRGSVCYSFIILSLKIPYAHFLALLN